MSRFEKRRFRAPWSLFALGLAVSVVKPAQAQEEKTVFVSFASASATQNGFLHGQIKLRYTFDGCGARPMLFFALVPGSAQGYEGYWYEGHMYGIQSAWRPPQTPALLADMHVSFNAQPIPVSPLQNPYAGPIGCGNAPQWRTLGSWSDYLKGGMKEEEALKRFDLDIGITKEPMRSAEIEASIRAQIRADSLNKARTARLEQAKKDSIARAQQAKTTTGTATTPSNARGTTAGANFTPPTSGTATAPTAPTTSGAAQGSATTQNAPMTEAEQKAQDKRDADEQARAIRAQLEAQQAAQEAQSRQIEEAATQIGSMVAGALEERRRQQERRWEQQVEASSRHRAYVDRMQKIYAALPARPRCTAADTLQALNVTSEASGAIIGSECRLADSSSAHVYPIHIAKKQKVEITATGTFNTQLKVSTSAAAVMASPDTGIYNSSIVTGFLTPGDYYLTVQTRQPGESGTYTVKVGKGELSRTRQWALGMYMGPISGTFTGVAEEPQFGNVGGFRATAGINQAISLEAVWGTADGETYLTYYDFGARIYLGSRTQRFRPVFDVLYGGRQMFADKGSSGSFYNGSGMTYAGGVEWFLDPRIGIELMYAKVGGTLDIDEPQTGMSPSIDYSHGALRLGMMFHR